MAVITGLLSLLFLWQVTFIKADCTDGEIELFSNENTASGHLLICSNSTLFQLCSTGFTEDNARAACRQLGYVEGRYIGPGRVLNRFEFINHTYLCEDSAIYLTNGGCSQFTSSNCASNRNVRLQCYNDFLSFVSSDDPDEPLSKSFVTIPFLLASPIRVGRDTFNNGFIYPYGMISFGDTPLTDNQLRGIPDINYRTHSFNIVAPFLDPTLSLRLAIEGGVFYNTSDSTMLVNKFIRNRTGEYFEAAGIAIIEWEMEDSDLEFQLILASDLEKTYAIITHTCDIGLRSTPVSAYIGYSLYNYSTEVFRYSETPYSHEIGCLNEGAGINYYNVLYRLSGNIESTTSSNTGSTCGEADLLTGCCQPFHDPTRSCRVTSSTGSSCYCDSLCYRHGDCCSDVGSNGLERPCLPVCQNGTVNQEGNIYYSEGPVSICVNGLQRYIRTDGSNINPLTRDVICQQIIDQITRAGNLADEGAQEIDDFFVDRTNFNCAGIERTVHECSSTMINIAQTTDSVLMTNCKNYIERNNSACINGEIRLRGQETVMLRLVEICVNGRWRPICSSSNTGTREATFICSTLGQSSTSVAISFRSIPNVTTALTTFMCPPDSSTITNCTVMIGDCPSRMTAHVNCNAPPPSMIISPSVTPTTW